MKLFLNDKIFTLFQFEKENDFELEVVKNSKKFFGKNSIYIDAKKKIHTISLGNSIPDGFLFDMSDKKNPEFYIVEVELASHDFYRHIFPQITKFFGFFKNHKGQNDLIEKIFSHINEDDEVRKEFKKYLGEKEIYKFIKDTIEKSQNILLVIDGDKKELPEIMETYTETWGKMVKLIQIKKYSNLTESIYTMHPDFENIEFAEIENEQEDDDIAQEYDESIHLEGVNEEIKNAYFKIKDYLLNIDPDLIFNPKKHYISIRKEKNIAFFILGRKKLKIVVLNPEEETRKIIKHHQIKSLTASVQKFWNGPSCAIILENEKNLDEVNILLKQLIEK